MHLLRSPLFILNDLMTLLKEKEKKSVFFFSQIWQFKEGASYEAHGDERVKFQVSSWKSMLKYIDVLLL